MTTRTTLSVLTLISPADGLGADASVNETFQELFDAAVAAQRASTASETFDLNTARARLTQKFSTALASLSTTDVTVRNEALADLAAHCEHIFNELST